MGRVFVGQQTGMGKTGRAFIGQQTVTGAGLCGSVNRNRRGEDRTGVCRSIDRNRRRSLWVNGQERMQGGHGRSL